MPSGRHGGAIHGTHDTHSRTGAGAGLDVDALRLEQALPDAQPDRDVDALRLEQAGPDEHADGDRDIAEPVTRDVGEGAAK